jgi:hypothetical protein
MSSDPNCGVCEGAGWDWRRAADDDLQVDDPVDRYQCPCVEVTRLRVAGDALAKVLAIDHHEIGCVDDKCNSMVALAAWQEARQ